MLCRFEERYNYIGSARRIYERAVDFFGEENMFEELFIAFARFEENQKEVSPCAVCLRCFVFCFL